MSIRGGISFSFRCFDANCLDDNGKPWDADCTLSQGSHKGKKVFGQTPVVFGELNNYSLYEVFINAFINPITLGSLVTAEK